MVTSTTGTTATPTPTPTPAVTTTNVTQTAAQALLTSLNAGSGVDTASLVTNLVQAQFATKTAQLTAKSDTLTAQISGISSLKSAITGFSSALDSLVKGGTLASQPVSSDSTVLTATGISGAKLSGLSSNILVTALASAQGVRTAAAVADRTAKIGSGTLTLSFGTATYGSDGTTMTAFNGDANGDGTDDKTLTIDLTDASLDGIAAAINAKKSGVTASIVTDTDGSAYLSLKGATGKTQAFTMTASGDAALSAFDVGPGATNTIVTSVAQNAKLTVDGVPVERASNTISDLVSGVKLQLTGTSSIAVALSATTPTTALSQAVNDVVDTYNQVLAIITAQTDPKTGTLRSDSGAQTLLKSLKALTLTPLGTGSPGTLAEIGVATNRDGTLRVDATTLTRAFTNTPDAVEAIFAPSTDGKTGLSAILATLSTRATDKTLGLGASEARYTKAETDIDVQKDKLSVQAESMTTRLTQQFASMNSRVSAYKSTQTFLTNQIAAWNKTT